MGLLHVVGHDEIVTRSTSSESNSSIRFVALGSRKTSVRPSTTRQVRRRVRMRYAGAAVSPERLVAGLRTR